MEQQCMEQCMEQPVSLCAGACPRHSTKSKGSPTRTPSAGGPGPLIKTCQTVAAQRCCATGTKQPPHEGSKHRRCPRKGTRPAHPTRVSAPAHRTGNVTPGGVEITHAKQRGGATAGRGGTGGSAGGGARDGAFIRLFLNCMYVITGKEAGQRERGGGGGAGPQGTRRGGCTPSHPPEPARGQPNIPMQNNKRDDDGGDRAGLTPR